MKNKKLVMGIIFILCIIFLLNGAKLSQCLIFQISVDQAIEHHE